MSDLIVDYYQHFYWLDCEYNELRFFATELDNTIVSPQYIITKINRDLEYIVLYRTHVTQSTIEFLQQLQDLLRFEGVDSYRLRFFKCEIIEEIDLSMLNPYAISYFDVKGLSLVVKPPQNTIKSTISGAYTDNDFSLAKIFSLSTEELYLLNLQKLSFLEELKKFKHVRILNLNHSMNGTIPGGLQLHNLEEFEYGPNMMVIDDQLLAAMRVASTEIIVHDWCKKNMTEFHIENAKMEPLPISSFIPPPPDRE